MKRALTRETPVHAGSGKRAIFDQRQCNNYTYSGDTAEGSSERVGVATLTDRKGSAVAHREMLRRLPLDWQGSAAPQQAR